MSKNRQIGTTNISVCHYHGCFTPRSGRAAPAGSPAMGGRGPPDHPRIGRGGCRFGVPPPYPNHDPKPPKSYPLSGPQGAPKRPHFSRHFSSQKMTRKVPEICVNFGSERAPKTAQNSCQFLQREAPFLDPPHPAQPRAPRASPRAPQEPTPGPQMAPWGGLGEPLGRPRGALGEA